MRLRILMLHCLYRSRGGEDVSVDEEVAALREAGHEVDLLKEHNAEHDRLALALRTVWSRSAYRDVRGRLAAARAAGRPYDVVHVQNWAYALGPSVILAAKAEGVAVVQAVRNYRLICPAATLWRDGHHCEDCIGTRMQWPAIRHGCDGRGRATALAVSNAVHKSPGGAWGGGRVDRYIAVSEYVRDALVRDGFPAGRIAVKPNCVTDTGTGPGDGGYALYVGRLSAEKGAQWLLQHWPRGLGRLMTIGSGEFYPLVVSDGTAPWLHHRGPRPHGEVLEMMGHARLVIVPSLWAEPFGRTVIEAYSKGTPVLAARRGGLSEIVGTTTGLLYEPHQPQMFEAKARRLWEDAPAKRPRCRRLYEQHYTPQATVRALEEIYAAAMAEHARAAQEQQEVAA